jgi:hypothetical protein
MISSYCGVFVTSDALNQAIIPRWFALLPINGGLSGEGNAFASSADGDVVYVATTRGFVYRCDHFNSICDTTPYLPYVAGSSISPLYYTNSPNYSFSNAGNGLPIEGIAVDQNDKNHVAIAISGFTSASQPHVYETKNGGRTWSPLTGLPNMPVYSIVIHDANTIIIGSELGMWSWDGSQWSEENNGFPRMAVYRMIESNLFSDGCPVIYLGTHGRGMWRSTTLTPTTCQTSIGTAVKDIKSTQVSDLNIFPNPVRTTSKISLSLDQTAPVTIRIIDMTGRVSKEITYRNTISGTNLFDLDASGLSNGTYLLSATVADTRTLSRLFVVTK